MINSYHYTVYYKLRYSKEYFIDLLREKPQFLKYVTALKKISEDQCYTVSDLKKIFSVDEIITITVWMSEIDIDDVEYHIDGVCKYSSVQE